MTSIDWNSGQHSGLVSIGTHSLWLRVAGPARNPEKPVVIIITGLASCSASWAAVMRYLGLFVRVYAYDRSGLGKSEPSSRPPTPENIGTEFDMLLQAANIAPPYVFVAHSWGGVLVRDVMISNRVNNIAGLVLVEANQEHTLERLDWRPLFDWFVDSGIDIPKELNLKRRSRLTDEEWAMSSTKLNHLCRLAEFQVDNTKSFASGQAAREQAQYENSFKELAEKRQLHQEPPYFSPIPVYIVKGDNAQDLKTLWKAVVALKGPSLAAPRYRDFLTSFDELDWSLQVEARSLSSFCRMAYSKGNGHDVQLTDFRDIIEAVEWVFSQWAFENWVTDSMSEDHFLDLSRSLIEFD